MKNATFAPLKATGTYPWWKSQRLQGIAFKVLIYVLLFAGSVIFLAPLGWMISTSLKRLEDVWTPTMQWIPNPIQFQNYIEALKTLPFFLYVKNSLFVASVGMIGSVLSASQIGRAHV
jgi:ABC-type glycerol-3-phosphate transport system permease component